jgi:hypothetical protein
MQPAYLPWLGYFHRIWLSDIHIVLDHVKIDRNSKTKFANRNKVRTKDGWCWLTVPLQTKSKSDQLNINKLQISNGSNWQYKHWHTIKHNYVKSNYFEQHRYFFEKVYSTPQNYLVDLIKEITDYLLKQLELKTEILYSSSLNAVGEKDDLILNLCKKVGAKKYISGIFGRDYINNEKFFTNNIQVEFHDYDHPVYPQQHSGFEPFMSIIDLLFNTGPDSANIIKTANSI